MAAMILHAAPAQARKKSQKSGKCAPAGFDAVRLGELRRELGDNSLASVLAVLSSDLSRSIDSIGQEIALDDEDALRRIVHRLVGTLSQFGLPQHARAIGRVDPSVRVPSATRVAIGETLRDALTVIDAETARLSHGKRGRRPATAPMKRDGAATD